MPKSVSLFQFVLGALGSRGVVAEPLRDFFPLVTEELLEIFPSTGQFSRPFEFDPGPLSSRPLPAAQSDGSLTHFRDSGSSAHHSDRLIAADPRLDEYRELIDDRSGRYVPVSSTGVLPCDPNMCVVYDRQLGCGLVEEDDELYAALARAMMDSGADVLARLPNSPRPLPGAAGRIGYRRCLAGHCASALFPCG